MPQKRPRKEASVARGVSVFASSEEYDELVAEFIRDASPRDVIERNFVTDAASLTWEIQQLRQLKAKILAQSTFDEISEIVWKSLINPKIDEIEKGGDIVGGLTWLHENDPATVNEIKQRAHDAAVRWCESDEGRREVAKLLQECGTDEAETEIKIYEECQDALGRADHSISMLENRRLRAIDAFWAHRAFSARKVRGRVIEGGTSTPQFLAQQT